MDVYLEFGKRRVFAGAIEWPGWCRSGRDEAEALDTLALYGKRYEAAIARAGLGFKPTSSFTIVERLRGGPITDFGAPEARPKADSRRLSAAELDRQTTLLRACWATFDATAKTHARATLRKGPRGGGRDLAKIMEHVYEADRAYLSAIGGQYQKIGDNNMARLRDAIVERLAATVRGELPAKTKRTKPLWAPRYCVRRSAWHALDHAWEIEDRSS
jgi:hypothetical protein